MLGPPRLRLLESARDRLAGGARAAGPLLPLPRCDARSRLRPHLGAGVVCRSRPPQHRPRRLLQAPAGDVLRRHPLGAGADAHGGGPAERAGEQRADTEQAALLEESLTLYRELGNRQGIAVVLDSLGMGAWARGDHERATVLLEESLTLYREVGDRRGIARLLGHQALVELYRRDCARAAALCQESLALYREVGDAWGVGRYLPVLAGAVFAQGQPARAVRLFAAGVALRTRLGTPLPPVVQPTHDRTVAAVRNVLGNEAFEATWSEGQALPLEEAVAAALADAVPV